MKIVLWRMAHDCLLTGVQLQCRHIPAKDAYVLRGGSESVEHLFFFVLPLSERICPYQALQKVLQEYEAMYVQILEQS